VQVGGWRRIGISDLEDWVSRLTCDGTTERSPIQKDSTLVLAQDAAGLVRVFLEDQIGNLGPLDQGRLSSAIDWMDQLAELLVALGSSRQ
jgi:hypothetical protein